MRLALLNTKDTPRARYILDCFRTGAATHGDECVWVEKGDDLTPLSEVDLGVQVCLANRWHHNEPEALFRLAAQARMRDLGKRLLVIDGIKGFADHCVRHMPGDRWAQLRRPLKPWRNKQNRPNILILGQPWHGQSSQAVDIYDSPMLSISGLFPLSSLLGKPAFKTGHHQIFF